MRVKAANARFRRKYGFLYDGRLRLLCLAVVASAAFAVRFSAPGGMLQGDDEYWHLHVVKQMLGLGYRPAVDFQAWAPTGRPMVHPPIYHYLLFAICKLFRLDAYTVMYYIGAVTAVIACLGWFLFTRELYDGWFAGLLAAGVYAVLPLTVAPTLVGAARPQAFAEALLPYALWLLLSACKAGKLWLGVLSGLVLGAMSLTWEASLYLYYPLVILFWGARVIAGKASKRLHILMLATLSVACAIALAYYLPVYIQFGVWGNTPAWMLESTMTFWRPDLGFLLYAQMVGNHVFYLISLAGFPLLIWRVAGDKRQLPREVFALAFMLLGLAGTLFFGMRVIGATLGFAVILSFTSLVQRAWKRLASERNKARLAALLGVLLAASNLYTAHFTAVEITPYYRAVSLEGLSKLIGVEIPYNATVICPLRDAAFLLGHGLRTPWDAYMEHLPAWAATQAREAANVYLQKSEDEAVRLMEKFNASWLLVRYQQALPEEFALLLEAAGVDGDARRYFNWSAVIGLRPTIIRGPFGEPLLSEAPAIIDYELAPTELGWQTLLAQLIWNEEANKFRGLKTPVPPPPEMFRLVWKSGDGMVMLYRVVAEK